PEPIQYPFGGTGNESWLWLSVGSTFCTGSSRLGEWQGKLPDTGNSSRRGDVIGNQTGPECAAPKRFGVWFQGSDSHIRDRRAICAQNSDAHFLETHRSRFAAVPFVSQLLRKRRPCQFVADICTYEIS